MPLLALGPHKFEIAPMSFQQLEDETVANWQAIARFGGRPGFQMTGFGEDPITISGLLYPEELGGREELDAVRATQKRGLPVLMVGWAGDQSEKARVFGQVGIRRVQRTQTNINRSGLGRKVAYSITVVPTSGGASFAGGWF
jgi:phage protein U